MSRKVQLKDHDEREDGEEGKLVISLCSSDDEEANKDLSLDIVAKATKRDGERKRKQTFMQINNKFVEFEHSDRTGLEESAVIYVSSSDVEFLSDQRGASDDTVMETKNEKNKKKSETEKIVGVEMPEQLPKTPEAVDMGAMEISNNVVMRKLLRGPRYFDPPEDSWGSCYNCGEAGHSTVNCTAEKRKKPCFICGQFGHGAKCCTEGRECYICKKRGHSAKDCSKKRKESPQDSKLCLRCGDVGHDMSSCRNDYAADDLKEIQCYICKRYGHLCCVDAIDPGPRELSCYNCGQSGHTGSGCATPRGETSGKRERSFKGEKSGRGSPALCYRCGEEGHFVRGCAKQAKFNRWMGEPSTPSPSFSKEDTDFFRFRSAPQYCGAAREKKSVQYQGRRIATALKSRPRGRWIADDSEYLRGKRIQANSWASPEPLARTASKTPGSSSGMRPLISLSPHTKHKSLTENPGSYFSKSPHQNGSVSSPWISNSRRKFERINDY